MSAWENGAIPSMDVALKVARALGVPLDYLADDAQDLPAVASTDDAERQLRGIVQRFGAERVVRRLLEVGMRGEPVPEVEPRIQISRDDGTEPI